MAENLTSKIPAFLLVLVGLAIVVWSVPQIYGLAHPDDTYQVESTDSLDDHPCHSQVNTSFDSPQNTGEHGCYELPELSATERRIVRRGLNRSGDFQARAASQLPYFGSERFEEGSGYATYYIDVDGSYYRLTVSSPWLDRAWLFIYVPALVLGVFSVGVGLFSYGSSTTVGPMALLAGLVALFGPSVLTKLDLVAPVDHPTYFVLVPIFVTGGYYLILHVLHRAVRRNS